MKHFLIGTAVICAVFGMVPSGSAATQLTIGTIDTFAVLAGTSVVNDSGPTVISGDVGVSPGTSLMGFPPGSIAGASHLNTTFALQAKTDLDGAYLDAEGQPAAFIIPSELGGTVQTPSVYNSPTGTFHISGTVTLDAQGNPDATFIFKSASTLITSGSSHVVLINGAQACNIFWQVGGSATLGTNSSFEGNIMALTSVMVSTNATVEGRILARNGSVMLDSDFITKPPCTTPPPPPAPAPPPPVLPIPPIVIPSGSPSFAGSSYWAPLPLINITKIPAPLALPSGAGTVTYTYTATNVGVVPMVDVWVRDTLCADVKYVSGDTNNDQILTVNESWIYHCTKMVTHTETNTATAHGWANGWDGYDTANATVVVSAPLIPPLIHLVKTPDTFVLPFGGGAVTYTYIVTNPGVVPLSDVSVIDDKCTGLPGRVLGDAGDVNKNDLLDPDEVWRFTCVSQLTQTTTNIGTAEGHANNLTAIDYSPVTVVVATPGLPNTGIGPWEGDSAPWDLTVPAWIVLILAVLYPARKEPASNGGPNS